MCSAAFRVFIRPLISYVILKSSEKTFLSSLSIPRIRGLLRGISLYLLDASLKKWVKEEIMRAFV